ncbi:MAG TPA: hypothetical protein VGI39_15380 [Polyangiaceae bacterium]|jgi:hypothetical protein
MRITLPSGRRVELDGRIRNTRSRRKEPPRLFAEVEDAALRGDFLVREVTGAPLELRVLPLADFHTLRAVGMNVGWLPEEQIEITCRNCGKPLTCHPCDGLALGPFQDGDLRYPELDATLPFGEPHPIPRIRLLGGADATDVTFAPRTLGEAIPLHEALAAPRLRITGEVVRAMGLVALGAETRPPRIARALMRASEEAFCAVGDHFLASHYPPRLFAIVPCPRCSARNDVDAPFDRELEPCSAEVSRQNRTSSNADPFPTFDAFDAVAKALAEEAMDSRGADEVAFVVEGGIPACDDGGDPLLGSYVPGDPGGGGHPTRAPEVTVYYRTFRAIHDEEGSYDWRAELEETIAHELDHHFAGLEGDDPVDAEERRAIELEAERIHGRRALLERALGAFGADVAGFLAKTWPIWLILLVAILAATWGEVH